MSFAVKTLSAVCVAAMLAGCADPNALGSRTISKGEQIGIKALLAAHPGQRACTEYSASSNSCASLITSRVSGNTLISREVAAVRGIDGKTEQIEVITRSRITDGKACVQANGISLGKNALGSDAAAFVLSFTKGLVEERGGVCGTYYRAGDGYVVASSGADGRPFPPGDTPFRFVTKDLALRAQ